MPEMNSRRPHLFHSWSPWQRYTVEHWFTHREGFFGPAIPGANFRETELRQFRTCEPCGKAQDKRLAEDVGHGAPISQAGERRIA